MDNESGCEVPLRGTLQLQKSTLEQSRILARTRRVVASPWFFLCLIGFGWVPLFIIDYLSHLYSHPGGNYDYWAGWAMAWGFAVMFPSTVAAAAWLIFRVVSFLVRTVIQDLR